MKIPASISAEKLHAILNVLVLNRDSVELMERRGVDPGDVILAFSYAVLWADHLPKDKK